MMAFMKETDVQPLRGPLLEWYDAHRRDLPWRRTSDPYAIWVSEVMLQQTQVARVVDYWTRFIGEFPTVEALAAASVDEVLSHWSGLGYYSRARRLHAAAREIVSERGGRLPATAGELRELPGMGSYTSAAVASIAFGEEVPVLDANVARVLARIRALRGDVGRAVTRRALLETAGLLVSGGRPGDVNQALMELGALVCLPKEPDCAVCPARFACGAHASGRPASFPGAVAGPAPVRLREAVLVLVSDGHVLLTDEPHPRGWWKGLWRLPSAGSGRPIPDGPPANPVGRLRYTVTRHRVELKVLLGDVPVRRVPPPSHRWVAFGELADVAVPAPHLRALALAGIQLRTAPRERGASSGGTGS